MLPLQKNLNFPIQFLALKIELALTSTFYPYVELSKIEVFMTQTLTSTFYPYVELSKIEVFMTQPPLLTRHSHWKLYPVRTHTVTA
jgi:hypothetical protein